MAATGDKIAKDINRGAAITFGGNLLKLLEFPLTLLSAGLFGAETWGQYVFLSTLLLPVLRLSTLGMDRGLVWFIARHHGHHVPPSFFGRAQRILAAAALAFIAAYGLYYWLARPSSEAEGRLLEPVSLGLFAAAMPFLALTNINLGISMGAKRPEHEVMVRGILQPLCYLALPCALAPFLGKDIRLLAAAYLLGGVLGHAWSIRLARPIREALARNPAGPESRDAFAVLFAYSWPLGLRDAVLAMQARVDIWVLALYLEPRYLGIYGLAASVAASLRTIRASFDGIMLAVIAQMKRGADAERIAGAYLHAAKMIMAAQAPVLAFLVFFARPILSLSGTGYAEGEAAVIVTAFTFALSGYLGLSSMVVLGLGKSRWALANDLGALGWAMLFNFLLVPRYGVTGAAVATSLSILLTNFAWYGEAIYLLKRVPANLSVVALFLASLASLAAAFGLWKAYGGPGLADRILYFALFALAFGSVAGIFMKKGLLSFRKG
jgi:O-antigen/teichoic acid export membrane protein